MHPEVIQDFALEVESFLRNPEDTRCVGRADALTKSLVGNLGIESVRGDLNYLEFQGPMEGFRLSGVESKDCWFYHKVVEFNGNVLDPAVGRIMKTEEYLGLFLDSRSRKIDPKCLSIERTQVFPTSKLI